MQITVSVPAKIHLLGEHTVVYGFPAILAAVGKRLYVRIKNKKRLVIHSRYGDRLIWQAISVFKEAYSCKKLPPLEISITSDIPVGAGMGSSAAVAAGVVGALIKYVKNIWNPIRINELVYEVEKIAHGNPSGADNTAVVFGGLVWYRKEFDFLKSIWSLPISQYKIPPFAFIDTGKPLESTKEMVALIAQNYAKNPQKLRDLFSDQEKQTKKLLLALKEDHKTDMKSAIYQGERNLEKMGVVSNFAQKIIRTVEDEGGVAKICGAGGKKKGSGIVLCFHEDISIIKRIAEKYELHFFQTELGGEGIRIEKGG